MTIRAMRPTIGDLARAQHGVITKAQLGTLGLTDTGIRSMLAGHEIHRVAPGTYVVYGAPPTQPQACAIALLSCKRGVLSGRTAAWLHSFDDIAEPGRPEVTVASTSSARNPAATIRRSQHFRHIRSSEVAGLRTASPAETVFRMAEYVGPWRLVRMIDALLLDQADSADELGDVYLRHQGERLRGMAKLRPLLLERLGDGPAPTESALEALAETIFSNIELPPVVRQAPLPWDPEAGRVDMFVPDWRLIIELDGRRWHARTDSFEADRLRDNAAVASGYSVLRFTWKMLNANPNRCLEQMRQAGSRFAS